MKISFKFIYTMLHNIQKSTKDVACKDTNSRSSIQIINILELKIKSKVKHKSLQIL